IFEICSAGVNISPELSELSRRVAGDGRHPATGTIDVDKRPSLDVVSPLPLDRESRVGVLDMGWLGIAIASQPRGQVVERIQQPCIAGFGREKNQLANADNAPVVLGSPLLNVAHLVGKPKTLAIYHTWARSPLNPFPTWSACRGVGHGTLHPLVRPSAGVRLSLLRPHRHSRLPDGPLPARARGLLLPRGWRRAGNHQGDIKRAHQPLPGLG